MLMLKEITSMYTSFKYLRYCGVSCYSLKEEVFFFFLGGLHPPIHQLYRHIFSMQYYKLLQKYDS